MIFKKNIFQKNMTEKKERFLNKRFIKICLPEDKSFNYDLDQNVNYDPRVELNIT